MYRHRFIIGLMISVSLLLTYQTVLGGIADSSITVIIKLRKPVGPVSVKTAPLKYNKDFAFSFTLDDGLVSAYLVAYPFFSGGKVSGTYTDQWGHDQGADGKRYPGLFYTDGCGGQIPFSAASAINAKNIADADTVDHAGFLSWKQIMNLYHGGWDILSHGYRHITGKGINAGYEVAENNRVVEDSLGIKMNDFVVPGGRDDDMSDNPYAEAAFNQGMQTVQCEHFPGHILVLDSTLKLSQLKLGRKFLHSTPDLAGGHAVEADTALFEEISRRLDKKSKFWVNAFTHSVGNQNLWNISLVFPDFKHFFNGLANHFGQQGLDNMWMAPIEEVYEYLLTRRNIKYHVERKGRYVKVHMYTGGIPAGLRHHAITVVVRSDKVIKKVTCVGCSIECYSRNKGQNLINLTWQ